jgi:hypothetical protein
MDKHAMLRYGIGRRRALERLQLLEAEEAAILAKFPDLPAPLTRGSQARTLGAGRRDAAAHRTERFEDPQAIQRIRFH